MPSYTTFSKKEEEGRKKRQHIPHSKRPKEYVIKRNRRERERVDNVNQAFVNLRDHLPFMKNDNRMSKITILKSASEYIQSLSGLIKNCDNNTSEKMTSHFTNTCKLFFNNSNLKTTGPQSQHPHQNHLPICGDYYMNITSNTQMSQNQPENVQELMVLSWIHKQLMTI